MRQLVCALALLLSASPAWAQGTEEEPTAAPGSIGYGMIETADADGVFELVHDGQVTLRHVQSGLVCHFLRSGDGGRLLIFPGLRRGDDVACDFNDGREFITLYATRFPFRASLDEQIQGAEQAIHQRFADATPFPVSADTSQETLLAHRTVEFIVTREGARTYTRASIAQVGDWTIKLRYSVLAPDDDAARAGEQSAAAIFAGALQEIVARPNL